MDIHIDTPKPSIQGPRASCSFWSVPKSRPWSRTTWRVSPWDLMLTRPVKRLRNWNHRKTMGKPEENGGLMRLNGV